MGRKAKEEKRENGEMTIIDSLNFTGSAGLPFQWITFTSLSKNADTSFSINFAT
jgi:hypothetical protein